MSSQYGQAGKTITIYANRNPEKNLDEWHGILKRITKQLAQAEIPPGYRPSGTKDKPEKPIRGSNYISYRYYNEEEKTNEWPVDDPCEIGCEGRVPLIIHVPNQPPIPYLQDDIIQKSIITLTNKK